MAVKFDTNDAMWFTGDSGRDEEKETGSQVETDAGTLAAVETWRTWRTCCPGASGGWPGCCLLLLEGKVRGQRQPLRGRGRQDEDSRGRVEVDQEETRTGRNIQDPVPETAIVHCLHPSRDSVSSILSSDSGTRF